MSDIPWRFQEYKEPTLSKAEFDKDRKKMENDPDYCKECWDHAEDLRQRDEFYAEKRRLKEKKKDKE